MLLVGRIVELHPMQGEGWVFYDMLVLPLQQAVLEVSALRRVVLEE